MFLIEQHRLLRHAYKELKHTKDGSHSHNKEKKRRKRRRDEDAHLDAETSDEDSGCIPKPKGIGEAIGIYDSMELDSSEETAIEYKNIQVCVFQLSRVDTSVESDRLNRSVFRKMSSRQVLNGTKLGEHKRTVR